MCLLAAGCAAPPAKVDVSDVEGYDPNCPRAAYDPKSPVRILSIPDGGWEVEANPRLEWRADDDVVGTVRFVSVRIFEVVEGKAGETPCVIIDDTAGALARANGCRLFEPVDGVLASFTGTHAGRTELKAGTDYLLVLRVTGSRKEEQCSVRFKTRQ